MAWTRMQLWPVQTDDNRITPTTLHRGAWQNLLLVKNHLRMAEAIPETECNWLKIIIHFIRSRMASKFSFMFIVSYIVPSSPQIYVYLSVCSSVHLSVRLSNCLSLHPSVRLSVHPSVRLFFPMSLTWENVIFFKYLMKENYHTLAGCIPFPE